jgi:hypothetical protein
MEQANGSFVSWELVPYMKKYAQVNSLSGFSCAYFFSILSRIFMKLQHNIDNLKSRAEKILGLNNDFGNRVYSSKATNLSTIKSPFEVGYIQIATGMLIELKLKVKSFGKN